MPSLKISKKRRLIGAAIQLGFTMLILRGPCYILVEIANGQSICIARFLQAFDPPEQFVCDILGYILAVVVICVVLSPTIKLALIFLCIYICVFP